MNSLIDVKKQIFEAGKHWQIPYMEFVDDFRKSRDICSIGAPFANNEERFDALLASTVEYLCREGEINDIPDWIQFVPACRKPWFVSGIESIKAIVIVESPLEFRMRKIFVLENFLDRA